MKKILLIGNCDSIFLRQYVEYVLLPSSYEIVCYTAANTRYQSFYKNNGIRVHVFDFPGDCIQNNGLARRLCNDLSYILQIAAFMLQNDSRNTSVIQVHFVTHMRALFAKCLRLVNRHATLIWSFWGSDLFRAPQKQIAWLKRLIEPSVICTAASLSLCDRFQEIFHPQDSACRFIDFGNATFPFLRKSKASAPLSFRKEFALSETKITVAIGYNGSVAQQHGKVIEALGRLPEALKESVQLFLHWGYGGLDASYLDEVRARVEASRIPYVICQDFMSPERIARLRCSIDIYINAQTTDAMSSSVLEYLLAGTQLVSGAWLKYPELAEWGVPYETFDDFLALTEVMTRVLTDFHRSVGQAHAFDERLYHAKAWETLSKEWREVIAPQGRQE